MQNLKEGLYPSIPVLQYLVSFHPSSRTNILSAIPGLVGWERVETLPWAGTLALLWWTMAAESKASPSADSGRDNSGPRTECKDHGADLWG